jgi:fatty-acyl-CoA synthase
VVGINPTRRGAELERDITYTDCQLIVTQKNQAHLLDGLDLGAANGRVLVVDDEHHASLLEAHQGATLPNVHVEPTDCFMLLFTSGTSGAPKAVITSHGRLDFVGSAMNMIVSLSPSDVTYISMPLFHSNALFSGWAPTLMAGAAVALRPKFSASAFIDDVRRYGATYFNYVGRPLAYILATPPTSHDRDHSLRIGFGNEGAEADLERFRERFGVQLIDGYGQTEMGASISRVPGMPAGSLGVAVSPNLKVMNPETSQECPPARFDEHGRLLNAEEATGEIVNCGPTAFEGYWKNDEANRERLRDGFYWTGDLAYRDDNGFFFFAGRTADWIRVDGENFAAAPIDRIVSRFPGVVVAAAYGVPDAEIGDRVMVALQMEDGVRFNAEEFAAFLSSQSDLGPKWVPTYIRIVDELPLTQTNKVLKRTLVSDKWESVTRGEGSMYVRYEKDIAYVPFGKTEYETLRAQFVASNREDKFA